ncbi:NAD(P)-dependent oxidoreductase [Rhodoferax sp.]|uniref:NAD(P)-dependent oxidoreductase n=1 Tax=Rhodoferax sp. TaxID=50421 RepID=UPI0027738A99|nr:NAD(P)-dependent oxidoreductase [Rhodoferax sp.]
MSPALTSSCTVDVRPGRLSPDEYARRFSDANPPLSGAQALLEAERCLYCFDAPCASACPTHIDVPSFIRRIADGNLRGSARAILQANPLGGMCARVCPTEVLCEQVCVRNTQEGKPVQIGRLQRHAVDAVMFDGTAAPVFTRGAPTGRRVAVIGAGPAGLACAHTLARLGHSVVMFDARPKAGGLNEYGLAAYKTPEGFAQRELAWLLSIGGIEVRNNWKLESAAQLAELRQHYDAVFLGLGLAGTQQLRVPGEYLNGVQDAVDFIATLRQTADLSSLPIGRRVVVIGGGMTAVDAAVQAKLLGAHVVHMAYRRGPDAMSASKAEQEWAQTHGVVLHHWLAPVEIVGHDGHVTAVRFAEQALVNGQLQASGRELTFEADMVFKAIGQQLLSTVLADAGVSLAGGRIATDDVGQTSLAGVWAGGDCRAGGLDLTVEAVEHGKGSAHAIHALIMRRAMT